MNYNVKFTEACTEKCSHLKRCRHGEPEGRGHPGATIVSAHRRLQLYLHDNTKIILNPRLQRGSILRLDGHALRARHDVDLIKDYLYVL